MTRRRGDYQVIPMLDEAFLVFGPRFIKFLNEQLECIQCYHPGCMKHIHYTPSTHTICCLEDDTHARHVDEIKKYSEPVKQATKVFIVLQRLAQDVVDEQFMNTTIHDLWIARER